MERRDTSRDRERATDRSLERALRGIESALQLALDVGAAIPGDGEEARRGARQHIAAAHAEIEELRAMAPEHELLRLWSEALAAIAPLDGSELAAPDLDSVRILARRLKADPPRSLSSQTLHGGLGLRSLIRD